MRTIFIGTAPQILSNANATRLRWALEFTPSSIVAGNTGLIYIGRGFVPNAVVGDPNQGDVMNPGSAIEEVKAFAEDTRPYKGTIWAVANVINQQITYDEQNAGE